MIEKIGDGGGRIMGFLNGLLGKKKEEPVPQEERPADAGSGETAGASGQVFRQELDGEAPDFRKLFWLNLLFREEPKRPDPQAFAEKLGEKLQSDIDIVTGQEDGIYSFAVKELLVEYQDNAKVPAQVLVTTPTPFRQESVTAFQRSQLWDVPNGEEFLAGCQYTVLLSDFMASGLPYLERARLLTAWLETALELFPGCVGVWTPSAGKLLTKERAVNNPLEGESRFLWYGVNVRFFNIQDSEDKVMDSVGLYALGLPDVQLHFRGLDPNPLANYLYNVAQYLYDNDVPIKPGETVDGVNAQGRIDQGIQWECRYEDALIQPPRPVMDICPGRFAAGRRQLDGEKRGNKK